MNTNEFSILIKKQRTNLNLTQKELANKLNVSNKTISRWETGSGYPDIEMIPQLARVLELNYEELLDGNEYIIKKEKKKQRRRLILISILFLGLIVLVLDKLTPRDDGFKSKYKNKDLLVSGDMIDQVRLDYQERAEYAVCTVTPIGVFDSTKSNALIKRLNVDNLILVAKDIQNKISYDDIDWKATMHFNYKDDLVLRVHLYYNDNKTYVLFNRNSNYLQISDGDLYYYDGIIEIGVDVFVDDVSSYNLNNKLMASSDLLIDVDKEQQLDILKRLLTSSPLEEGVIIFNDGSHGKVYLVIVGKSVKYKKIDVSENKNILDINLTGENMVLANKTVNIYELKESYQEYNLEICGQSKNVITINT